MEYDLPLYAVQRLANGYWLVRATTGDPVGPRVDVAACDRDTATCLPVRPSTTASHPR